MLVGRSLSFRRPDFRNVGEARKHARRHLRNGLLAAAEEERRRCGADEDLAAVRSKLRIRTCRVATELEQRQELCFLDWSHISRPLSVPLVERRLGNDAYRSHPADVE